MLYSKTETEEDSPKKDMHPARNIKVQGWKPRSLLDELNEMSEQLWNQIFKDYKAKKAQVGLMKTTTVHGIIHNRLTGDQGTQVPIVMDSGCLQSAHNSDC